MRALKSPAISDRASVFKVERKLSLNPRTPTSAATPTATDSTTKLNLPGEALRSRQPIAAARRHPNARLAILRLPLDKHVFHHQAILQNNLPVGAARNFWIVCDQHQRSSRLAIAFQQQVEDD